MGRTMKTVKHHVGQLLQAINDVTESPVFWSVAYTVAGAMSGVLFFVSKQFGWLLAWAFCIAAAGHYAQKIATEKAALERRIEYLDCLTDMEYRKLVSFMLDANRKPADVTFTASAARDAARAFEEYVCIHAGRVNAAAELNSQTFRGRRTA